MNITQRVFKSIKGKKVTYGEIQNFVFKAQGRTREDVKSPRGYYCINIQGWHEKGYITKNDIAKKYELTKLGELYITDKKTALLKVKIKNLKRQVVRSSNAYEFWRNEYNELSSFYQNNRGVKNELDEANYKLNKIFKILTN